MKVATVQMPIVDGECSVNHLVLAQMLDNAPGADLYLVPELWTSGYVVDKWEKIARIDTPLTLDWMAKQAKSRKIWLGGSVIAQHKDSALCNRFVLFDRNGELVGYYDKIHRFLPMGEGILEPGDHMPIFNIEGVRVAPAICYDLRFPEMFRRLALEEVDLFLVPSEWPCPREVPLTILAGARAIENQAYLLLSNRTGVDAAGQQFCGCSGLFGPFGVVDMLPENEIGIMSFELDMQQIKRSRENLAVFAERRQGVDYD
ncbi:Carbon-nitrogen hydrolase [Pelosinus fermentans]|uniref:nitrilase-related carbon-nitrogen hydrolase n=1 Tax=Pelosinus fermentans TaxID=365349 RepID=UPI0002685C2A|nr:nitrilase-related carbon-nitrogen hydrolase [Pelosinus fermentans]OAM92784.1 Nitrilase/cyanide hydratase and apolipoprotein N-acyltransferase [Pelosinus fermentans DSM 17108]SDQ56747.1 Carbon-nitrogen hydrolase [Pelosinus fermentans]